MTDLFSPKNNIIGNMPTFFNNLCCTFKDIILGGDITGQGTKFKAENGIDINAGGVVTFTATKDTTYVHSESQSDGWTDTSDSSTTSTLTNNAAVFDAGKGGVKVTSKGNQTFEATEFIVGEGKNVELTSTKGKVIFAAVKDIFDHQETHSSSDAFWISGGNSSQHDETVKMVKLDNAKFIIKAAEGIQVDLKQDATVDQESIEATINALKNQPGMEWLKDMAANGQIDWQQIKEVHKQHESSYQGLGPASQIIVAIALSMVMPGGAALVGTGGAVVTAAGAAASAALTSAASMGLNALVANNGNLGDALNSLDRSSTYQNLFTSALSAGAGSYLNGVLNPSTVNAANQAGNAASTATNTASTAANSASTLNTVAGVSQYFANQLVTNFTSSTITAIVNDTDLGQAYQQGVVTSFANTVGATGFNNGANNLSGLSLGVTHAVTGAATGYILNGEDGAIAGATSALASKLASDLISDISLQDNGLTNKPLETALTQTVGALSTLAVDETGQSAGTGKLVAGLEMDYNKDLHKDQVAAAKKFATTLAAKMGKDPNDLKQDLLAMMCAQQNCAAGIVPGSSNKDDQYWLGLQNRGVQLLQWASSSSNAGDYKQYARDLNQYIQQNDLVNYGLGDKLKDFGKALIVPVKIIASQPNETLQKLNTGFNKGVNVVLGSAAAVPTLIATKGDLDAARYVAENTDVINVGTVLNSALNTINAAATNNTGIPIFLGGIPVSSEALQGLAISVGTASPRIFNAAVNLTNTIASGVTWVTTSNSDNIFVQSTPYNLPVYQSDNPTVNAYNKIFNVGIDVGLGVGVTKLNIPEIAPTLNNLGNANVVTPVVKLGDYIGDAFKSSGGVDDITAQINKMKIENGANADNNIWSYQVSAIPAQSTFNGTMYRATGTGYDPLVIHDGNVAASHRYTEPGIGGGYFATGQHVVDAEFTGNGGSLAGTTMHIFDNQTITGLLDLSNPIVRQQMGVQLDDLIRVGGTQEWRYEITQPIGRWANENGYNGVLAPSAQADGGVNVILFDTNQVKK